ncbi:hypothetical protein D3C81_880620 [compost metagenome]
MLTWPLLVMLIWRPGSTVTTAPCATARAPFTYGLPAVSVRSAPARCVKRPLRASSWYSSGVHTSSAAAGSVPLATVWPVAGLKRSTGIFTSIRASLTTTTPSRPVTA